MQEHTTQIDSLHSAGQTEGHGEKGNGNLFMELLHHTQDSRELEYPGGHLDLPVILFDEGRLHFYFSNEKMKEEGVYSLKDEHVVRTSDGHTPALDLSITKHVVFLWLAAVILVIALGN